MTFLDIPYDANAQKRWSVPIPGDGERIFETRDAAMLFAMQLAKKEESEGSGKT